MGMCLEQGNGLFVAGNLVSIDAHYDITRLHALGPCRTRRIATIPIGKALDATFSIFVKGFQLYAQAMFVRRKCNGVCRSVRPWYDVCPTTR